MLHFTHHGCDEILGPMLRQWQTGGALGSAAGATIAIAPMPCSAAAVLEGGLPASSR